MTLSHLHGKKILLLGYGKEGKATERFLRAHIPDATILIADQTTDANYLAQQQHADVAIRTPGLPKRFVTIPYTTATNLFFEYLQTHHPRTRTIGVTGSKGKSTTSSLIAHILKHAGTRVHLVGNIGVPALDVVQEHIGDDDIFVVELSSYQLDDIAFSPTISVWTSLFPDHLPYHGGFENYVAAKANILQHMRPEDIFIFNPRFSALRDLAQTCRGRTIPYREDAWLLRTETKLKGEHNRDNICGAATVAQALQLSDDLIAEGIRTFEPLPHRLTEVGTFRGITFIDDANATTPEAAISALHALPNVTTMFLGGEDRGYDFRTLAEAIRINRVKNIVFFPTSGERIEQDIKALGVQLDHTLHTRHMEDAIRFAYAHTPPGTTCLLSTGSPSYGIWKNFEEKGEQFAHWVHTLNT